MSKQHKKALVTGGSGFIGSNLVRELEKRGHEVWICDLMHCEKERFVRCDVSKYRQVERLFEEHDFTMSIMLRQSMADGTEKTTTKTYGLQTLWALKTF